MTPSFRTLFIAWQDPNTRAIHPVARVAARDSGRGFEVSYIAGVRDAIRAGFRPFAHMGRFERRYTIADLRSFPLTSNRLMPESRPDFPKHLERLGLARGAEPLQILARSEGRRATDNLEFFAEPESALPDGPWVYRAWVRGVRYVDRSEDVIRSLEEGHELTIVEDLENSWDARALALEAPSRGRLGFVPGALLDDLHAARRLGLAVRVFVDKINLPPAPAQQRCLVRVEVPKHPDFAPFSSEMFGSLAER